MMPLFVFTADWHIARSAWARSQITGDSYFGLTQVVDYCIAHKLPLVAAGDLLDTQDPHPDDVHKLRYEITRLEQNNCNLYFIQGQHERESRPWLSSLHRHPQHLGGDLGSTAWFLAGDHIVAGFDWQPAGQLAAALQGVPPEARILVCHQVWREFMGSQVECEGSLADVPEHVQLVLTGDLHKHTTLALPRGDGSCGAALSPGSLCMQSIDEEPDKKFYVVGVPDDGDGFCWQSVPLEGRRCYRFHVETAAYLEELVTTRLPVLRAGIAVQHLPESLRTPLVRVHYNTDLPEARARIEAAAKGCCHLFLTPVDPAVQAAEAVDHQAVLQALRERGMLGVLANLRIDAPDPEAVRRDVAALLEAADPAEFLESL